MSTPTDIPEPERTKPGFGRFLATSLNLGEGQLFWGQIIINESNKTDVGLLGDDVCSECRPIWIRVSSPLSLLSKLSR